MVFNNGIVLQYGYLSSVGQGGSVKVTLPKAYTTTNYGSFSCPYTSTNIWANAASHSKTTTSFYVMNVANRGGNRAYHWFAIGY